MEAPSPKLRFPAFKEGWKEARLARFFRSSRAKGEEGMPTLSVTLSRGLINRSEIERKTETNLGAHEHLLVRKGDIAYNMMRMWQGAFGRSDRDGIVSPAYVVLRPQTTADSGYFEYAFRRARSIYLFWAYSYGITNDRLRLYANDFLRIPFSAPTLPEQRKIAEFLTAVDGRIGQLSQKKALLEDYKKGAMQQLFTQALRFKDDHGNDFPEWEEKELGDSIDLLSGFPFASEDILDGQAANDRERILLMRGVNITEGSIRHSEDQDRFYCGNVSKLQKYKLEVGDMVIGMDGSKVGKNSALVGEAERGSLLVQRVARIRALAGTSLPFIYQHVNSFLFHRYVDQVKTSSGIPHISAKQIREFTIGFPCLAEQTKIADFLTALDRKIESVSQQITHTQTFKKGLLQQMFV